MNKQEMKNLRGKLQERIGIICDSKDRELETKMSREELETLRNSTIEKVERIGYDYLEAQYTKYAKGLVNKYSVEKSIDYLVDKIEKEIPKIEKMEPEKILTSLAPLGLYCCAFDYIGENLM